MEKNKVRNPVYTSIGDIDIEILEGENWLPFTASANDCEVRGRDLYSRALKGEFGSIGECVVEESDECKLRKLKEIASDELRRTDIVALRCVKNGVSFTQDWRDYYNSLLIIMDAVQYSDSLFIPPAPASYPPGS